MANQEHLDLLKQGVEIWNQWRQENATIRPDLSEAPLAKIDLGIFQKLGIHSGMSKLRSNSLHRSLRM